MHNANCEYAAIQLRTRRAPWGKMDTLPGTLGRSARGDIVEIRETGSVRRSGARRDGLGRAGARRNVPTLPLQDVVAVPSQHSRPCKCDGRNSVHAAARSDGLARARHSSPIQHFTSWVGQHDFLGSVEQRNVAPECRQPAANVAIDCARKVAQPRDLRQPVELRVVERGLKEVGREPTLRISTSPAPDCGAHLQQRGPPDHVRRW
jgi:hypothetical protein